MPELRKDPVTGKHVIIAIERGKRPSDLKETNEEIKPKSYVETCPFCVGNEEKTPPEIDRIENENEWVTRVVPNKFPALSMESECEDSNQRLFWKKNGVGYHEVIIETRDHSKSLFNMEVNDFVNILKTYKKRYNELINKDEIKYVSIFKNYKKKAGASLEHSHSQAIALPLVPNLVKEELEASKKYFEKYKRCIFCDIINEEIKDDKRIVINDDHFVVLAPFASIYNYELMIIPKAHQHSFKDITENELKMLAESMKEVFNRLNKVIGDFPFNMYIHTLPKGMEKYKKSYHWHIEISPRLSNHAGLELGSGIYINTVAPEDAVKNLRNI
ncbi:galactose-1-phosphate uridylyltransferase [Caldisalinibacter kiritimatiensis]|uniref:Galactose-1-phosphate uridylyltransferase n=1 Tax=Caldisalinibacter kiritimatiensis TaxID=1304284 RepID=R1AY08_9FIRM|nr:galactose-1-phosphate uridylyltransferase [Caldisalinibacter kiritimatiensis]EOD01537.1 Galactose-1-phosphate uridylyltransferase [Caldisalinibacter kiritimatiensis]